jgi:fatty-acyl-CoA synthase
MTIIRTESDIAMIERDGLAAFLPHASPFALIEASAARYPDKPAIRYIARVGAPETDAVLNYHDFAGRIRQAANLFRRLGVTKNDAVAILAPHVLSTQIALWAAEVAGRACPINPMLAPAHVVELLRAAGAKIAIVLGANDDLESGRSSCRPCARPAFSAMFSTATPIGRRKAPTAGSRT